MVCCAHEALSAVVPRVMLVVAGTRVCETNNRRKTPRGRRGGSSHSSSSRNSSGDSSSAKEGVPPPAAVMAAMAAMWPQAAASAAGKGGARTPSSQSLGADFTSAAASDDRLEAEPKLSLASLFSFLGAI